MLIFILSFRDIIDGHRSIIHIYFDAANNWRVGRELYQPGLHGFLYLPPSAVLHFPFALLPYGLGDLAWRLLSVSLFTAGMWRLARLVVPESAGRVMALMLLTTIPAAGTDIIRGQDTVMMAALMMHATVEVAVSRCGWAAVWLALAVGIKPLALVLVLLFGVLYRPLRWPLLIALTAILLLPFLHPDPLYVAQQYLSAFHKLLVAAQPTAGRWNEATMMLHKFGCDPDYKLMTKVRLGMAAVTLALSWVAVRRNNLADGALMVLSLAICYLLPFNPRTEEGSYITLAAIVSLHAGRAWYREDGRWGPRGLILLSLGLGTQSYGDWIYRPTDLWLKPVLCLVFMAYLGWRIRARPTLASPELRPCLDSYRPYRRSSGSTADRVQGRWFQAVDSAGLAQAARQTPTTDSRQGRL